MATLSEVSAETGVDLPVEVQQVISPHAEPQVRAPAVEDNNDQLLASAVSSLELSEEKKAQDQPAAPHRSHDPQFNQKRSDPFQFGSRFLEDGDDPFEFNAWDHVETDDTYKEYAEQQYEMQRQSPVSDFDKCKLISQRTSSHFTLLPQRHSL